MITPETYLRRTFEIEAVRITEENFHEVARWCLAEEKTQTRPARKGESGYTREVPYLKVDVLRPLNDKQTMAFVGDWVLKTGTSFKIYSDIAFHKNFEKKESYDDILLPESEAEFMVLRHGQWEPMTPEELKEKLAPVVRATLEDMRHEDEVPELHVEDSIVPQVRLSRPGMSETSSD